MISLAKLKQDIPKFNIPYMYYYLDDTPLLDYLEKNIQPKGEAIIHSFNNITSEQICNN